MGEGCGRAARALVWGVLAGLGQGAQAAQVERFTPQGEAIDARQAVAKFSAPMVPGGNPDAPAPFTVDCPVPGSSRWVDERTWAWDFERDLPSGTTCTFTLRPGLATAKGEALGGPRQYRVSSGGPYVRSVRPWQGSGDVDEHQAFVLTLSGPATEASVRESAHCAIEGVAERVPVALVAGEQRRAVLDAVLGKPPRAPRPGEESREAREARTVVLQCAQRAGAGAKLGLHWGPGVRTASGLATTRPQQFDFRVRERFTASLTCERPNAQSPCTPVLPVRVVFSAPVARKDAERLRLRTPQGERRPVFESRDRDVVGSVSFAPPFAESAALVLELPADLKDESGRPLANASSFPLAFRTGEAPPLARFASGSFGVLELEAEPALPITLRRVELPSGAGAQQVRRLRLDDDAAILAALAQLRAFERTDRPNANPARDTRGRSMLAGREGVAALALPAPREPAARDGWPFEVVGLPMREPGFWVVELESARLGAALLAKPQPMFVRTSALVTNLSVHFRAGRERSAVWVTTLDRAQPVPGARVRITDCNGTPVWEGATDAQGLAIVPQELPEPRCAVRRDAASEGAAGGASDDDGFFPEAPHFLVTARAKDARGREDLAFVLSSWNRGIEAWRFDLPTHWERGARLRAHAVLDRSLLRAGETLSIKAYARSETARGLALLPADRLPPRAVLTHVGSGQEFGVPLAWAGVRYASASFAIPREARLGAYEIALELPPKRVARAAGAASPSRVPADGAGAGSGVEADPEEDADSGPTRLPAGRFRVEEFRLPTMTGRVAPAAGASLVAPRELPVAVQLDYLSGGPASGLPVRVSALARERALTFEGWDGFSFEPLRLGAGNEELPPSQRLVADRRALTLDAQGSGALVLKDLPPVTRATDLVIEASYSDPSGELQTLSHTAVLWPAALAVGIRTGGWVSVSKGASAQVVVLDARGRPLPGREVEVSAAARRTLSHRKRLVGGFYAYDHREERRPLGTVCSGRTDANGLLACKIALKEPGNVELVATARDDAGRAATAAASLWVTGRGELWFDGENHDRIDLIPEKRRYQPGETAKLQVRMPFRHATALVAVEREGVIDTQVVRLTGRDPTVSVPIRAGYGPNVYVSVLAVRERLRDVPWYSLFQWGWRNPVDWWREWRAYRAPDAMVDLTRPAYRLGIAELRVGLASNELQVQVQADRAEYPVRGRAQVTVSVRTPDGRPLPAGTPVAFAAVDQALLELSPNASWSLLDAMMARRPYGMETYTAQMHVVGRRHFGRKAVAPGGGGGRGATRELFDTLLLWRPAVPLGADGSARIEVPLNDSLTSFALVAIADADTALFGTGRATIRTTQPLQLVSGLPPLVRDGDRYRAAVTVRNTSAREMSIEVSARAAGHGELAPQRVRLAPNAAQEVGWTVTVPAGESVDWELAARELEGAGVADRLRVRQRVAAAVPSQVQQATILQLDRPRSMSFVAPAASLPGSARVDVDLQASLAAPMPGVRRWFERYPYQCLEQKASRAIGLRDEAMWSALLRQLPAYLDRDGLASYFPVTDGGAQGSDVLTAYLLAASHEAGYAIPDDALARMQAGLAAWVDGRIERASRAPSPDLVPRKLAAIEALARRGRAQPRMLESIRPEPGGWPTHAVIDWVSVLRRMGDVPDRGKRLDEAWAVLRGRLDLSGTRLAFSTERSDDWWWTMASPDANASRLLLAVLDDAGWRDDLPRLLAGTLQRQSGGAWRTTTANLWGSLAVERFARRVEAGAVSGSTRAALGALAREHAWRGAGGAHLELPLPAAGAAAPSPGGASAPGAPAAQSAPAAGGPSPSTLSLSHQGGGSPWATVASVAAVPLASAVASGLRVSKTVTPVDAKTPGALSRGDTLRVRLTIDAQSDIGWVVVSDPLPAGAAVLGGGLGRDSQIGTRGEQRGGVAWPTYEERSQEAFRAYYEYLPKGSVQLEYTVRLNASGTFRLPPTRAEAMYAPDVFGALPNAALVVR